jgi:hypothetical protein
MYVVTEELVLKGTCEINLGYVCIKVENVCY